MQNSKIYPVAPINNTVFDNTLCDNDNCDELKCDNTILYCQRKSTHQNLFDKKMDKLYDIIYTYYKKTPAYNLSNRNQELSLLSSDNNVSNRFKRWWFEDYIIVEQNAWTKFNYIFTFILLILTIIMIIYIYHNDLILVPKKLIKEETMSEDDKNTIRYYDTIELSAKIINGVSAIYIISLSLYRIFKRTTI